MEAKLDLLHQRMDEYEREPPDALSIEEIQAGANKWDGEHVQLQKGCKRNCRKKKDGRFPFFPEMNLWWYQRRVYKWLVKFHNGKSVKLKSLLKAREQNDITQPNDLTMKSVRAGIEICDKKLEELRPVAHAKQRKHLTERLKHDCKQENE